LVFGTWSAAHQNAPIATTCLTAGLILLFAATIDRFESLKGWGIEAKTRQLDQKIEEANQMLDRLKELAEITGAALMDLNSKMGRWDTAPTPTESYALADKVRSILTALDFGPDKTAETMRPWVRMMCFDLTLAITTPLRRAIKNEISRLNRQRSELRQPLDPNDPEFLRLNGLINSANTFIAERLSKVHKWEIEDFPDRLTEAFVDVPLLDAGTVTSLRSQAIRFVPAMRTLRENYTITDIAAWSEVVKTAREDRPH
jgi:hypothetical protein